MARRTWYLVRHGETVWNAERRMQGRMDSALSVRGEEQAKRSGAALATLGVDRLFASPLGRVRATLALIAPFMSAPPTFDDRLVEWSAGAWSGRLYDEIARDEPFVFAAWERDRYGVRSPGGENFADLAARAKSFLADATAATEPVARIAIVAHGFMNRALAAELLGLSPQATVALRQPNDVIYRISTGEGGALADHFIAAEGPFAGLPGGVPPAGESA